MLLLWNLGIEDPLNAKIEKFDPQLIKSFNNYFINGDHDFHHLEDEYLQFPLRFLKVPIALMEIAPLISDSDLDNKVWEETDICWLKTRILHLAAVKKLISPHFVLRRMNELLEELRGKYDKQLDQERALFIIGSLVQFSQDPALRQYFRISLLTRIYAFRIRLES